MNQGKNCTRLDQCVESTYSVSPSIYRDCMGSLTGSVEDVEDLGVGLVGDGGLAAEVVCLNPVPRRDAILAD